MFAPATSAEGALDEVRGAPGAPHVCLVRRRQRISETRTRATGLPPPNTSGSSPKHLWHLPGPPFSSESARRPRARAPAPSTAPPRSSPPSGTRGPRARPRSSASRATLAAARAPVIPAWLSGHGATASPDLGDAHKSDRASSPKHLWHLAAADPQGSHGATFRAHGSRLFLESARSFSNRIHPL